MSDLKTGKNFPLNKRGRMVKSVGGTKQNIVNTKGARIHYFRDDYIDPKAWKYDRQVFIAKNKKYGQLRGWEKPYANTFTTTMRGEQVEHPLAKYDAHMQGGVEKSLKERRGVGHDLPNLVIASRKTNIEKGTKSLADWTPSHNVKWFAEHVEKINVKHDLSFSPKSAVKFKSITGRDTKAKIKAPAYQTLLCQSCHTPSR